MSSASFDYWSSHINKQPYPWLAVLIGVLSIVRSVTQVFIFRDPFKIHRDSKLFYHIGYIITTGHVPYVDVWEVKPPLTYETAALVSLLGGGDPWLTHLVGVAATGAMMIGITVMIYVVTADTFENQYSGLVSAAVWASYPAVHYFPVLGFRVKYFALFFGLFGLWLTLQDRPLLSGVVTAAAAAYWQFAIVFCLLVILLHCTDAVDRHRGGKSLSEAISKVAWLLGGFMISFVVVVGPIAIAGGLFAMLSEVIISGLVAGEDPNVLRRLGLGLLKLKSAIPLVLIGAVGFIRFLRQDAHRFAWISAGGVLFGLQILFVDFDGAPDLLGGYLFVALSVGGLYALSSGPKSYVVSILVAGCLVFSLVFMGGTGAIVRPVYEDRPNESEQAVLTKGVRAVGEAVGGSSLTGPRRTGDADLREQLGLPTIDKIYRTNWDPTTCHYFLSTAEQNYIKQTSAEWGDVKCGASSFNELLALINNLD